jgi:hypothetical protein
MNLPVRVPRRREASEPFHSLGSHERFSVGDFWAWSMSDLVVNTNRGLVAEFLVAEALGVAGGVRDPWQPFDLTTPEGVTIEVKSGSYVQAWAQKEHSYLQFSIEPSKAWDPETGEWEKVRRRQADVYVFCILAHREQETLDPLDLSQWSFLVLRTSVLDEYVGSGKSVSLSRLERLGPVASDFSRLAATIRQIAQRGGPVLK